MSRLDRKMIDTKEFLCLAYAFAGETWDETQVIEKEGLRRRLANRAARGGEMPKAVRCTLC